MRIRNTHCSSFELGCNFYNTAEFAIEAFGSPWREIGSKPERFGIQLTWPHTCAIDV